jgi:hypothetical protein
MPQKKLDNVDVAIKRAIYAGHNEIAMFLLPHSEQDPHVFLIYAASVDNVTIAQELMKTKLLSSSKNILDLGNAFSAACVNESTNVLRLFLNSDASLSKKLIQDQFEYACITCRYSTVKTLLKDDRVDPRCVYLFAQDWDNGIHGLLLRDDRCTDLVRNN